MLGKKKILTTKSEGSNFFNLCSLLNFICVSLIIFCFSRLSAASNSSPLNNKTQLWLVVSGNIFSFFSDFSKHSKTNPSSMTSSTEYTKSHLTQGLVHNSRNHIFKWSTISMKSWIVIHLKNRDTKVFMDQEIASNQIKVSQFALESMFHRIQAMKHHLLTASLWQPSIVTNT